MEDRLTILREIRMDAITAKQKAYQEKMDQCMEQIKAALDEKLFTSLKKVAKEYNLASFAFGLEAYNRVRLYLFYRPGYRPNSSDAFKEYIIDLCHIDYEQLENVDLHKLYDMSKDYIHENIIPFTHKNDGVWVWRGDHDLL